MGKNILLVGDSSEIAQSLKEKALENGYRIHVGYNTRNKDNENDPSKTYVDSTDYKSIDNLIFEARERLGGIDHLIYTSGISEKRWSTESIR